MNRSVVITGLNARYGGYMVAALRDLTEHGVDTIKPIGFAVVGNQEELTTTGVWSAGLGHGDGARFVLQAVIGFVGDGVGCLADTIGSLLLLAVAVAKELRSMATGPITVGEIAALNHEVIDNSVENRVVVIAVFHEEFEILNVDGGIAWIKFDRHRSGVCSAVPTQFKFHDVRGGVGSVGDVDHGQDQRSKHRW